MAAPQRRCICCGQSSPQAELLRFVWQSGEVHWDEHHRLPGRGAYVHPRAGCFARMTEVARWRRALRLGEVPVERAMLAGSAEAVRSRIEGLGSIAGSEGPRRRRIW